MSSPIIQLPERRPMGPVDCSVCGIDELLNLIQSCRKTPRRGLVINFINAHLYNVCWEHPTIRTLINNSDVIAADGMAIVWAARLFGFRIPERCNMTDSFRAYLADTTMPPATAILIGGSGEEAARAAATIHNDGPHLQITASLSGFLDVEEYATKVVSLPSTDFILLGMGTPKSEQVAARLRSVRPEAMIWHIGGGTVMFYAGSLVEAPAWMRTCGLQWLHRLLLEPRRMWKRYVIGNPLFVWRAVLAAWRQKRGANAKDAESSVQ